MNTRLKRVSNRPVVSSFSREIELFLDYMQLYAIEIVCVEQVSKIIQPNLYKNIAIYRNHASFRCTIFGVLASTDIRRGITYSKANSFLRGYKKQTKSQANQSLTDSKSKRNEGGWISLYQPLYTFPTHRYVFQVSYSNNNIVSPLEISHWLCDLIKDTRNQLMKSLINTIDWIRIIHPSSTSWSTERDGR